MLKGHPKGLFVLFFANMGERFGYYTMLAIFVLYLQENFGWDAEKSGQIYGYFLFAIYFMPLFGGWLADKVLGYGKTIALGTVIMIAGYALLAVPTHTELLVYGSLAVISIGNGMFKGNLAVIVGNLYGKERGSLRDAAFNIYYMGINIGAFFSPHAARFAKDYFHEGLGYSLAQGYNAGFALAGLSMVVSLLVFLLFRKYYAHADYRFEEKAEEKKEEALTKKQERERIVALLIVFAIVIFFWMAFHQSGFTLTLFAKNYTASNVSPYTYMIFDLPALLSIIAVLLGIIFTLRRKAAAWSRILALIIALAGAGFGYYRLTTYLEKPSKEVCLDRLSDIEKTQTQIETFLNEKPLAQDAEWIDRIKKIDTLEAKEIAQQVKDKKPYAQSNAHVPPLKVYCLYNEKVIAGTEPMTEGQNNFMTALSALEFEAASQIPALYEKAGNSDAGQNALFEKLAALADQGPFLSKEEKQNLDPSSEKAKIQATVEGLFYVAQHMARMEDEAAIVSGDTILRLAALTDKTSHDLSRAASLEKTVKFRAEFFDALAATLGKLSGEQFKTAEVIKIPGRISPELFLAFNPIFIVFLTPLIIGFFAWLNRRKKEPSSPGKIGIGMFVTAIGFGLMALASMSLASVADLGDGRAGFSTLVSPYWLIWTYFTLTIAELFLSPMGLSFVSKVAPPKLRGLMQGGWLGSTAVGNLLCGLIGVFYKQWELWQFFILIVGAAIVSSILILLLLKKLKAATQ